MMKNKKRIALGICVILFIYFIGGIIYNFRSDNKKIKIQKKVDNSVQIKDFDYILLENDLEIYKNEFKKLKKNLESSNINYLEYAHSISKMFIIDLYSLDNKKNMYDVGGVEFIYPDAQANYKLNVENTLYKYLEDNSDNDRKQVLPIVKNVVITNDEEVTYNIGDVEYDGYKIKLDIEYIKDLEYDKSAELILIKSDKYLYIVEKN